MDEINKINRATIVCNHAEYKGECTHRLHLWGDEKMKVYPRVKLFNRFFGEFNPRLVDFIEIATFLYVADQMVVRCQGRVDPHGTLWRRDMNMIIAVQDFDFWNAPQVAGLLERLLRFLSDDRFRIQFSPLRETHPDQGYFDFKDKMGTTEPPEQVILFSGGLDSLGGAIQEMICDGRRTVLVRHKSSTKHKARYLHLEQELQKRSDNKGTFFTINTGKDGKLTEEYTQRCRSFLYFALGATIAHLLGLDSLRFYENGPISLNLPMSPQVVGGRATRTTHPRTLFYFQELIRLITGKPNFSISNPFINLTKSDIVRMITDNGCGDLIPYSMSCAHSWQQETNLHTHCGICSQCIDRRVAIIAAGKPQYDQIEDYAVDFFTEAVDKKVDDFDSPNKNLLTSFFLRGRQIGNPNYGYDDFEMDFPMLSDAVMYMGKDPDVAAGNIFKLYKRLAQDILKVEKYTLLSPEYIARACDLENPLSPDSLYGILSRGVRPIMEQEQKVLPVEMPEYIFRLKGESWELRYKGGEINILQNYAGCSYIVRLLAQPNTPLTLEEIDPSNIPSAEICVDADELAQGFNSGNSYEPATDKKALEEYNTKLKELRAGLELARAENNSVYELACEEEMDQIKAHLSKVLKVGGKARNLNTANKKKTDQIRRNIKTVCTKIAVFDSELSEHLHKQISIGEKTVTYKSPQTVTWATK